MWYYLETSLIVAYSYIKHFLVRYCIENGHQHASSLVNVSHLDIDIKFMSIHSLAYEPFAYPLDFLVPNVVLFGQSTIDNIWYLRYVDVYGDPLSVQGVTLPDGMYCSININSRTYMV